MDGQTWRTVWRRPDFAVRDIIVGGGQLFVGGDDEVRAVMLDSGQDGWRVPVRGRALSLSLADGRLFAATDTGAIYCFAPDEPGREAAAMTPTEFRHAVRQRGNGGN